MKKFYLLVASCLAFNGMAQDRTILVETFTSSTCPPCNPGNIVLENLLAEPANEGKTVSLKYQMSWPGTGDPYFTGEGNTRRGYYSVGSVPHTRVDAGFADNTNNILQTDFDDAYAVAPKVSIEAYYQVDEPGKTVDIQVDVTALEDVGSGYRTFVAIFEYVTDNNVKSNGETEFYHVMKKLVPGTTGSTLPSLATDETEHYDLSYTFNGSYVLPPNATDPIDHSVEHSIEEFSDLGVAVWVQHLSSKEVLHAAYAQLGTAGLEESEAVNFAKVYPNPSNEMATLVYNTSFDQSVDIELVDVNGKSIWSNHIDNVPAGRNQEAISTSDLSNGLYLVRIKTDEGEMTERLSVQH